MVQYVKICKVFSLLVGKYFYVRGCNIERGVIYFQDMTITLEHIGINFDDLNFRKVQIILTLNRRILLNVVALNMKERSH